jgi:hypothetical protein
MARADGRSQQKPTVDPSKSRRQEPTVDPDIIKQTSSLLSISVIANKKIKHYSYPQELM